MGLFHKEVSTEQLTETVFTEASELRINEEEGVVENCKLIGLESQNGHAYTDPALAGAVSLYEGAEVFLDHPPAGREKQERPTVESVGNIRNVRHQPGENRGDFHYLKSHPHTPLLLERIRRGYAIGFSHNAEGKTVVRGGKKLVESINKVRSVDLVRRPATTRSLKESLDDETTVGDVLKEYDGTDAELTALVEYAMASPTMAKAPMQAPQQGQDAASTIRQAILTALSAKLAEADQATLKKVATDLGMSDSLSANAAADGGQPQVQPMKEELEKLTEQVTEGQQQIASLTKKLALRDFMEANNVSGKSLGPERLKLLEACENAEGMKALLDTWPPAVRNARPPLAQLQSLTESQQGGTAPQSFQATRSLIRSR